MNRRKFIKSTAISSVAFGTLGLMKNRSYSIVEMRRMLYKTKMPHGTEVLCKNDGKVWNFNCVKFDNYQAQFWSRTEERTHYFISKYDGLTSPQKKRV